MKNLKFIFGILCQKNLLASVLLDFFKQVFCLWQFFPVQLLLSFYGWYVYFWFTGLTTLEAVNKAVDTLTLFAVISYLFWYLGVYLVQVRQKIGKLLKSS